MSLLMEALRKAEEAKRRINEQSASEDSGAIRLPESPLSLSRESERQAEPSNKTADRLQQSSPTSPQQAPTATAAAHTLDQRSANALFLAKQRAQRRQQQRQRVAVLLSLLLLLPIACGLFYWQQIQIVSTTGITASPQFPDSESGPDNQATAPLAENPSADRVPAANESHSILDSPAVNGSPVVPAIIARAQAAPQDNSSATDNPEIDSGITANPASSAGAREGSDTGETSETSEATRPVVNNDTGPAESTQSNAAPDDSDRILSLSHRDSTLVISPELSSAYEHFLSGNLPAATADYLLLLEIEPNNRQAMLGLATIYRRRGDIAAAQDLYARLLEMNPRDPLARTGLINAASAADPLQRASDLRQLQEAYPSLAPITFALGNLHASQGRWREAQGAYFNALRKARDSDDGPISPDYAFNLAISLERLGEPVLAYDYYQQAERLAQVVAPGFDREVLQQRLQALQ